MMKKFLEVYFPPKVKNDVSKEIIDKYKNQLPKMIIDLWKKYGFGNYEFGMIKIINPDDLEIFVKLKLGMDTTMVAFMVDSFGNIFYYDKNSDNVGVINVEYNFIDLCSYTFDDFINKILDNNFRIVFLRKRMFEKLIFSDKQLKDNEIYIFNPPLFLNGVEKYNNVVIKDMIKYYNFIFPFLVSLDINDQKE